MPMLATAVGLGLGAWAMCLGGAALAQRRLIFKPPVRVRSLPPGPFVGQNRIEPLALHCEDGAVLRGWRSTPLQVAPQGWLLYFGGRGENVAWAPQMATYLGNWGVLAFNYRGFGGSTGLATEALVTSDARCLHTAFMPPGASQVLMGRSLGTAVALRLAATVAPQALVLVSPFVSLVHLARARVLMAPGAWLLQHRLDSREHAPRVTCPSLVLLAAGDREVPNRHSLALAARLGGPVERVAITGPSHRGLPRSVPAQQRVAAFVRSVQAPTA